MQTAPRAPAVDPHVKIHAGFLCPEGAPSEGMGTFFVIGGVQAGGMKVSELGEVPLMERISQRLPRCRRDVGVGDDVATLDLKRGMYQLAIAISRWKEFIFSVGLSPPINWGATEQPSTSGTSNPNEGFVSTCWSRWRCLQTWRLAEWRLCTTAYGRKSLGTAPRSW